MCVAAIEHARSGRWQPGCYGATAPVSTVGRETNNNKKGRDAYSIQHIARHENQCGRCKFAAGKQFFSAGTKRQNDSCQ